jgi:hypothetical protein
MNFARCLFVIACGVLSAGTLAAGPIKRIDIYITPYYEAARDPTGTPTVAVHKNYDSLLASNRREDIVYVRDEISRNNGMVTPMTMMVLAIRLYDLGLRDDAVLWFYAAKDRFITLANVADMKSHDLAQVEEAIKNFAVLAGPVLNGYAFCDVAKQQDMRHKAMRWVISNPYKAMFLPQVPARPGDRQENLRKGVAEIEAAAEKERQYLANPANVADLRAKRQQNNADATYCWQ